MSRIDQRLADLNLILPNFPAPVAKYVPAIIHAGVIVVAGQLPRRDKDIITGQVGVDLDVGGGRKAARLCALAILAILKDALDGDLDRVACCVQLTGFVNAPAAFIDHSQVVDGASELMVDVFGAEGHHARVAVGASSLPLGAAVEVAGTFGVR